MNVHMYPENTPGRALAVALFTHHLRAGDHSPEAGLGRIQQPLHTLDLGTGNRREIDGEVLRLLDILVSEFGSLPWQGFIGDHKAAGTSLSVAARLLALWLPRPPASWLEPGTVPAELADEPELLIERMTLFAGWMSRVAERLSGRLADARREHRVDVSTIATDVADLHDLALGYSTAAWMLEQLGYRELTIGVIGWDYGHKPLPAAA